MIYLSRRDISFVRKLLIIRTFESNKGGRRERDNIVNSLIMASDWDLYHLQEVIVFLWGIEDTDRPRSMYFNGQVHDAVRSSFRSAWRNSFPEQFRVLCIRKVGDPDRYSLCGHTHTHTRTRFETLFLTTIVFVDQIRLNLSTRETIHYVCKICTVAGT